MIAQDIPIVGGAYEAADLLQDAQRLINWYVEVSGDEKSKEPTALLGCPGLTTIISIGTAAQLRGCWVLPGGKQALFVAAATVWLMSISVPATQTSSPSFVVTPVGTLLTSSGYVCIRDNGPLFGGAGGYAVLVDGQYGYYYRMSGAGTTTFTAATVSGSNTITPTTVQYYLIAGSAVVDTGGATGSSTITSVNYNAGTITLSSNAALTTSADTFTVTYAAFGQIVDPAFLPASRVAFIEGWLIFNNVGTRTFFTNAPIPYTLTFAGAFYALKDSSTDNLVTLYENNRELWLIGERTSEVWYNAGGANFAFSRIPGVGPQAGCSAAHSVARCGLALVWLAQNEQGQNIVLGTDQYTFERLSTHAIEHAISQYPVVSDAIAYAYEEEGHQFYVLNFPTADTNWTYDTTTKMWHQRLSYDPNAGVYHRHRSNVFMNFANVRIVGDYQNGNLYQMSRKFFSDNGPPIRRQRRTPHVWSKANRMRVFQSSLQIEFTPGVGLQAGQGSNPQVMVRWSNNGGFSWSNEHWVSIGKAGAVTNRAILRRLGQARDRVYEVNFTDPVQADIIGATLFGEAEEDAA